MWIVAVVTGLVLSDRVRVAELVSLSSRPGELIGEIVRTGHGELAGESLAYEGGREPGDILDHRSRSALVTADQSTMNATGMAAIATPSQV